jgi:hypothetical protein
MRCDLAEAVFERGRVGCRVGHRSGHPRCTAAPSETINGCNGASAVPMSAIRV